MAAGSLLSSHWAGTLTPFIQSQGVELVTPPLAAIVQTILVLLPPVLLFMSGPGYSKMWPRLLGSLAFTLLAFTFLLDPIAMGVTLEDASLSVFGFFTTYQSLFIVIGVIAALVDVLLTRTKGKGKH